MCGTIRSLKITHFKSIDVLELHDLQPFSVFAGPNGSGKSNFFDALDFVSKILRFGAEEAIRQYGGVENMRCRRAEKSNQNFEFEMETFVESFNATYQKIPFICHYQLVLENLSTEPLLKEQIKISFFDEEKKEYLPLNDQDNRINDLKKAVKQQLANLRIYRIDPVSAKFPSLSSYDSTQLHERGENLAAVLHRFTEYPDLLETISEWLELVVPSFQKLKTHTESLTGSTVLALQEQGVEKPFPAHLISDGTVYLLCLLAAVLPIRALVLIEEPERGLHPKAIQELVTLFREKAIGQHRIWLSTHSETVVRALHKEELWLVDKDSNGITQMKKAKIPDHIPLSIDQMWLSNGLNGGLPW